MNAYIINYDRLSYLGERLQTGQASKPEKDEYMLLLRQGNHITEQQYNDYVANRNTEDILNAAMAVGAIVLIGYILKELFKPK